jgi:hypothetical protein
MSKKSQTHEKGKILERVVALLHKTPGLEVEQNYSYPVEEVEDGEEETREIDVLIRAKRAEVIIEFAIECKNLGSKVGVELIDAFAGKLNDIGMPTGQGIFVAINGYTRPALRRAAKAGIRPLLLRGLTEDRLKSAYEEAFRYVVYLMPELGMIQSFDNSLGSRPVIEMLSYGLGQQADTRELIVNNVWEKWFNGDIPRAIGCHIFRLRMHAAKPEVEGEVKDFYPQVNVLGVVVESRGKVSRRDLNDAPTGATVRSRVEMGFANNGRSTLRFFGTTKALEGFLDSRQKSRLTIGVIPMPRLQFQSFFWPISNKARQRAMDLLGQGEELSFEQVEGLDLSVAWGDFLVDEYAVHEYAAALRSSEIEFERFPSVPIHSSAWVEAVAETAQESA